MGLPTQLLQLLLTPPLQLLLMLPLLLYLTVLVVSAMALATSAMDLEGTLQSTLLPLRLPFTPQSPRLPPLPSTTITHRLLLPTPRQLLPTLLQLLPPQA